MSAYDECEEPARNVSITELCCPQCASSLAPCAQTLKNPKASPRIAILCRSCEWGLMVTAARMQPFLWRGVGAGGEA